jgi:5-methylcytosine-specific restriction endonuclease McrA
LVGHFLVSKSEKRLIQLYNELQNLLVKEEILRRETEALLKNAQKKIDPRAEFNNWLQSSDGQSWRQKQYEYQKRCCAYCKESLRFEDSVVHHVIPLQQLGRQANKPENLKLLHPSCNLKIGTKIIEFD